VDDRRAKQALRLALLTPYESVGTRNESCSDTRSDDVEDADIVKHHTQTITAALNRYFKAQQESFPFGLIEQLLERLAESESAQDQEQENGLDEGSAHLMEEVEAVLVDWTEKERARSGSSLVEPLEAAATAGFLATFNRWMNRLGLDWKPTPGMMGDLRNWAKRQAARLLTLIDRTTRRHIVRIITKGLKGQHPVKRIVGEIREYLDRTMTHRAGMSASAEANNAFNHGAFDAHRLLGATFKQWVTRRDSSVCAICRDNEFQGPIPIGKPFLSGHQHPRAHLFCRCTLIYFGITPDSALHALNQTL